jgi:uncharacterized membrane protein HdeD (DUF308 family)
MSSTAGAAGTSSGAEAPDTMQTMLAKAGVSWSSLLGLGLVMLALGVVMLAWPEATLLVLAATFAISLFVSGAYHLVAGFVLDHGTGTRVLHVLVGTMSVLAGFLCLRAPLQTLVVIGLLVGSWWVVTGIAEIVTAIAQEGQPDRWWRLAMGVLSVVAGAFVLLQPELSLFALKMVIAVWLLAYGLAASVAAVTMRMHRRHATAPTPPSTEGLAPA